MVARGKGYGAVKAEAFLGFQLDLADGVWGPITVDPSLVEGPLDAAAVDGMDQRTFMKLRLVRATHLLEIVSGTGETAAELDAAWDSAQRRLDLALSMALESADPTHVAAAGRLRARLLLGTGRAQTQLPLVEEVDFGQAQVAHARDPGIKADIQLLGLQGYMTDIATTTTALAAGIGRVVGSTRVDSPTRRQRSALGECVASFNGVHDTLEWLLVNTVDSKARGVLDQMLTPMTDLLARNPVTTVAAATPAATPTATAPAAHPAVPAGAAPAAPVATPVGTPAAGPPTAPAGVSPQGPSAATAAASANVFQGPAADVPHPTNAPAAPAARGHRRGAVQASTAAGGAGTPGAVKARKRIKPATAAGALKSVGPTTRTARSPAAPKAATVRKPSGATVNGVKPRAKG